MATKVFEGMTIEQYPTHYEVSLRDWWLSGYGSGWCTRCGPIYKEETFAARGCPLCDEPPGTEWPPSSMIAQCRRVIRMARTLWSAFEIHPYWEADSGSAYTPYTHMTNAGGQTWESLSDAFWRGSYCFPAYQDPEVWSLSELLIPPATTEWRRPVVITKPLIASQLMERTVSDTDVHVLIRDAHEDHCETGSGSIGLTDDLTTRTDELIEFLKYGPTVWPFKIQDSIPEYALLAMVALALALETMQNIDLKQSSYRDPADDPHIRKTFEEAQWLILEASQRRLQDDLRSVENEKTRLIPLAQRGKKIRENQDRGRELALKAKKKLTEYRRKKVLQAAERIRRRFRHNKEEAPSLNALSRLIAKEFARQRDVRLRDNFRQQTIYKVLLTAAKSKPNKITRDS